MILRTRPGVGVKSAGPRSDRRSLLVQTSMCIKAGFEPFSYLLGPWAVDGSFVSYKGIEGGFEEL